MAYRQRTPPPLSEPLRDNDSGGSTSEDSGPPISRGFPWALFPRDPDGSPYNDSSASKAAKFGDSSSRDSRLTVSSFSESVKYPTLAQLATLALNEDRARPVERTSAPPTYPAERPARTAPQPWPRYPRVYTAEEVAILLGNLPPGGTLPDEPASPRLDSPLKLSKSSSRKKRPNKYIQMFTTQRSTVVSAPGKVLMAGGYLVLERQHCGLVVGTSSRFYTCITHMPLPEASTKSSDSRSTSRSTRKDPPNVPELGTGSADKAGGEKKKEEQAVSGGDQPLPKPKKTKKTSAGFTAEDDPRAALVTVQAGQFPSSEATWIYRVELDDAYLPPPPPENSENKADPSIGAPKEKTTAKVEATPEDTSSKKEKSDPNPNVTPPPPLASAIVPVQPSGNTAKRAYRSSLQALMEVEKAAGIPLPPSPENTFAENTFDVKERDEDPSPPLRSARVLPTMFVQPPTPAQEIRATSLPPPPRARPVLHITQITGVGRNKFIEIALSRTLEIAWEMICENQVAHEAQVKAGETLLQRLRGTGDGIIVIVLGDNDFYSQRPQLVKERLPLRLESLSKLQPFISLPQAINKTSKTGLGSSAALTTSFVAALLTHLSIVELPTPQDPAAFDIDKWRSPLVSSSLALVHSVAQLSHCISQGKIGSGFDVASAVYGSHQYRRFSPSLLQPLMSAPVSPIQLGSLLLHLDPERWNQQIMRMRLPRGIRIMLADVDIGTDTPSFVSKVLKWKAKNADDAKHIWQRLDRANNSLEERIATLRDMENRPNYDEALKLAANYTMTDLDLAEQIDHKIYDIYSALKLIRLYMGVLSDFCDVPIEPHVQTTLLDACQKLPGVIGGGVPGAGGFDAIYLLVIDQPEVVTAVEDLWEEWKDISVCPLSSSEAFGGLQVEKIEEVRGLKEKLEQVVDGA